MLKCKYLLIRKLVKLLLSYGANIISRQSGQELEIYQWIFLISGDMSDLLNVNERFTGDNTVTADKDSFISIMDSFENIFRYLVLAGASDNVNVPQDAIARELTGEWLGSDSLTDIVIAHVGYSFSSGRSSTKESTGSCATSNHLFVIAQRPYV